MSLITAGKERMTDLWSAWWMDKMTPELRRSCLRVATTVNSVLFLNFRSMCSATSSVAFTFREAPETERKMLSQYSYLIRPAESTHWVQIYSSLWIYIHANGESLNLFHWLEFHLTWWWLEWNWNGFLKEHDICHVNVELWYQKVM